MFDKSLFCELYSHLPKPKIKWDARQLTGLHAPLSPLGSLFELTLMMFLEGIIASLIQRLNIDEEDIKSRHANIETISC